MRRVGSVLSILMVCCVAQAAAQPRQVGSAAEAAAWLLPLELRKPAVARMTAEALLSGKAAAPSTGAGCELVSVDAQVELLPSFLRATVVYRLRGTDGASRDAIVGVPKQDAFGRLLPLVLLKVRVGGEGVRTFQAWDEEHPSPFGLVGGSLAGVLHQANEASWWQWPVALPGTKEIEITVEYLQILARTEWHDDVLAWRQSLGLGTLARWPKPPRVSLQLCLRGLTPKQAGLVALERAGVAMVQGSQNGAYVWRTPEAAGPDLQFLAQLQREEVLAMQGAPLQKVLAEETRLLAHVDAVVRASRFAQPVTDAQVGRLLDSIDEAFRGDDAATSGLARAASAAWSEKASRWHGYVCEDCLGRRWDAEAPPVGGVAAETASGVFSEGIFREEAERLDEACAERRWRLRAWRGFCLLSPVVPALLSVLAQVSRRRRWQATPHFAALAVGCWLIAAFLFLDVWL
jgi:hypothetical protein